MGSKTKMYSWDVEVFAVGKWNGFQFGKADLDAIAEAFEELHGAGYLEAPLKLGHNDEQQMTDGYPALGWVDSLYVKEDEKGRDKLFARFTDVPEPVYNAAKSKMYRKVSIELDFDVEHKGKHYPYVLTGIALLGADLPAVNTLADLNAYMGRTSLRASNHMAFSAVDNSGNPISEGMMEISEEELKKLKAQAAKAEAAEDTIAEFKRKEQEREETERKERVKAARSNVNAVFEKAVREERITPAQRDRFAKLLNVDDDEAVTAIKESDVTDLVETFGRKSNGDGESAKADPDNARAEGEDSGDRLTFSAQKIRAENPKLSFSAALEMAMQADRESAVEHINATYNQEG